MAGVNAIKFQSLLCLFCSGCVCVCVCVCVCACFTTSVLATYTTEPRSVGKIIINAFFFTVHTINFYTIVNISKISRTLLTPGYRQMN